jgi:hypothetical protein
MISTGKAWTDADLAAVREHYPLGGSQAVLKHVSGRSIRAIQNQASLLRLVAPDKDLWTPAQDAVLREHYARSGARAVAAMIGRTVQGVRRRATVLKVSGSNRRPRPEQRKEKAPKPNPIRALRKPAAKPTRGMVGEPIITSATRVTICPHGEDTRFLPDGPVPRVVDSAECRGWVRDRWAA